MSKRYLTASEVKARYDGAVSIKTLANWRSSRIGPPYTKIGGHVMYPIDGLEDWERQRTFNQVSKAG